MEFNKKFIVLHLEIEFDSIVVFCGDNATSLQECAKKGRVMNNTVDLDTTVEYTKVYRPSSLYYYEIYTSTIIVTGFIKSSDTGKNVQLLQSN